MQLKTDYREQNTGVLQGTKQYFLVCHVTFSAEERATIQERGLYNESIDVPAATPPPTRAGDFPAFLMYVAGIISMPVGLLASCATGLAHSNASTPFFFLFLLGIGLFVVGKMKNRASVKRAENPDQSVTVRQLLTNPEFLVWAPALDVAKIYEEQVREQLQQLAHVIRQNIAVPERNVYEL